MINNKVGETEVREYLLTKQTVSVPMLQEELKISYAAAREILSVAINRAWVSEQADGIYYKVYHDNIQEISLPEKKIKRLERILTTDCFLILEYLSKNGYGHFSKLVGVVMMYKDTRDAIKILMSEKLIYGVDDTFFLRISKQAIVMLKERSQKRKERHSESKRSLTDIQSKLDKKFDDLFGNDNDVTDDDDSSDDDE